MLLLIDFAVKGVKSAYNPFSDENEGFESFVSHFHLCSSILALNLWVTYVTHSIGLL